VTAQRRESTLVRILSSKRPTGSRTHRRADLAACGGHRRYWGGFSRALLYDSLAEENLRFAGLYGMSQPGA
jgi:hypothetical protein